MQKHSPILYTFELSVREKNRLMPTQPYVSVSLNVRLLWRNRCAGWNGSCTANSVPVPAM